jgi:hypothetical protein
MAKTPERWIEEAEALLDIGARMVDADTVRALLGHIKILSDELHKWRTGRVLQGVQEDAYADGYSKGYADAKAGK